MPREEVGAQLYYFFNLGARCGWVVNAKPRPLEPLATDPVLLLWEIGWDPGPSKQLQKYLSPPGFDPRSVQPTAGIIDGTNLEFTKIRCYLKV